MDLDGLIERHHGNLSKMADDIGGITRQGLAYRLKKLDLFDRCAQARAEAGITGPRRNLPRALIRRERDRIIDACARARLYNDACAELGISKTTLHRKMRELNISPHLILARRYRGRSII